MSRTYELDKAGPQRWRRHLVYLQHCAPYGGAWRAGRRCVGVRSPGRRCVAVRSIGQRLWRKGWAVSVGRCWWVCRGGALATRCDLSAGQGTTQPQQACMQGPVQNQVQGSSKSTVRIACWGLRAEHDAAGDVLRDSTSREEAATASALSPPGT